MQKRQDTKQLSLCLQYLMFVNPSHVWEKNEKDARLFSMRSYAETSLLLSRMPWLPIFQSKRCPNEQSPFFLTCNTAFLTFCGCFTSWMKMLLMGSGEILFIWVMYWFSNERAIYQKDLFLLRLFLVCVCST